MNSRVLGVLDGRDMPLDLLARWAESAEVLMAADGAADRLLSAGVVPHRIVGDFDAVSQGAMRSGALLVRDPDQGRTDCDKLLSLAWAGKHAAITLASVEGDLPDHSLATLHSALASGLAVRIAYRRGIGWMLRNGDEVSVSATTGARVSLLPLAHCDDVCLAGVEWPVDAAVMRPGGFSSISNRATEPTIQASLGLGAALLFVEYPAEEMPFW